MGFHTFYNKLSKAGRVVLPALFFLNSVYSQDGWEMELQFQGLYPSSNVVVLDSAFGLITITNDSKGEIIVDQVSFEGKHLSRKIITVFTDYGISFLTKPVIKDDSIILAGDISDMTSNDQQICLLFFDFNMNLIDNRIYGEPLVTEHVNDIFLKQNSLIAVGSDHISGLYRPTLYSFVNSDSTMSKHYLDTLSNYPLWSGVFLVNKNSFLVHSFYWSILEASVIDYSVVDTILLPAGYRLSTTIESVPNSSYSIVAGTYQDIQNNDKNCAYSILYEDSIVEEMVYFGTQNIDEVILGTKCISARDEDNIYIVGASNFNEVNYFSNESRKILILKTNVTGTKHWLRYYKGEVSYHPYFVLALSDGGAIILSKKNDFSQSGINHSIHLLKVDSLGNYTPMSIGPQPSEKEKYVTIYPNPATKQVTLRFENRVSEAVGVSVFDMAGNLLREFEPGQPTTGGELTLDISGLSPGAYILRIRLDRTSLVKWLVVR